MVFVNVNKVRFDSKCSRNDIDTVKFRPPKHCAQFTQFQKSFESRQQEEYKKIRRQAPNNVDNL